ncbi:Cell wall assembly regulator [Tulasnella sp. 331]|nr:Cell wall assembly regulator [Tulasnella sp. 331]
MASDRRSESDEDTEVLLVMLQSLLDEQMPEEALLEALWSADGDVDLAAHALRDKRASSTRTIVTAQKAKTKRKRGGTMLENWLVLHEPVPSALAKKPRSSSKTTAPTRRRSREEAVIIVDNEESLAGPSSSKMLTMTRTPEKPKMSLLDVLRAPPNSPPASMMPKLAPMTLVTPTVIAKHTPTTLHTSILPPDLACRLYFTLLDEAEASWQRSKWFLVERLVESPHLTSFYIRDKESNEWNESAKYWYNGLEAPAAMSFPSELEEACSYVEKVVNEELEKRKRFGAEWGGDTGWKANVAAANRYKGAKEGVGFHSDGLTYLGPYPTIASLSLGTERIFRLRETIPMDEKTRTAQTFNIPLPHNSLLIMHAACQEHFKHSIPILPGSGIDVFRPPFLRDDVTDRARAYNERINVTFRFYRPDFGPESIPRCRCNVPTVLRANQKGRGRTAVDSGAAEMRYFWVCYAGAQNEGKSCGFVKVLDMKAEGRGPLLSDVLASGKSVEGHTRFSMPTILQTLASLFTGSNSRETGGPLSAGPSTRRRTLVSSTKDAFSLSTHSPTMDAAERSASINGPTSSTAFSYPPTSPTNTYDYVPHSDYTGQQHPSPIFKSLGKNSSPILPMHNDPSSNTIHVSPKDSYPALHHTWNRLRTWLAAEYNELGDTLNYGIDPSIVSGVEMELGLPLPSAVRDSYLICDGQEVESSAGCSEGLFFGLTLLPLEDVLEEWRFWREVDEDPNTGANDHLRGVMQSIPEDYVRREYSCRGWLPLVTDRAGNYLGVDLHPADQGSYGQVIVFGRDFDTKVVMWRGEGEGGWGRWLSGLVDELENGDGFEMAGAGDGSSGSEDELGYESYFQSPTAAGRGDRADGAGGGLRLTGDYKGWNVLEAWADRSVKRWIETGIYKEPEPEPEPEPESVEKPDIEIINASPTKPLAAVKPILDLGEQQTQSLGLIKSSSTDDISTATTPTTLRPPESVSTERSSSVSETSLPIPKPVPMPSADDFLSGSSPTFSAPASSRLSEDEHSPQLQHLSSAPTRQLQMASENPSLTDVDLDSRPLVADTSFTSVHRDDSIKSMASAELMAPPSSNILGIGSSQQTDSTLETILPAALTTRVQKEIEIMTPTAQSFTKPSFTNISEVAPPVPSKTPPTSSSSKSGRSLTNGSVAPLAPLKVSRLARSNSPGAAVSPSKVPLPTGDVASPIVEPSLPDSRPGTPNSVGSAASKHRQSKTLHNKSTTKSISNFFNKDKDGVKDKEKESAPRGSSEDMKDKDKTRSKRGSAFGAPFKTLVSSAGKKKEKEKEKDELVS